MIKKIIKIFYDDEESKILTISEFTWLNSIGFTIFGGGSLCIGVVLFIVGLNSSGFEIILWGAASLFFIVSYLVDPENIVFQA